MLNDRLKSRQRVRAMPVRLHQRLLGNDERFIKQYPVLSSNYRLEVDLFSQIV